MKRGIFLLLILSLNSHAAGPALPNIWPLLKKSQLVSLDAQKRAFDIEAVGSRVTVVVLWASWCEFCKAEMQQLVKFQSRFTDSSYKIIAISEDEKIENAINSAKAHHFPFLLAYDQRSTLQKTLPKHVIPVTLIFDPTRRLVGWFKGYNPVRQKRIEAAIENSVRIFAQPQAKPTPTSD